MKDRKNVLLTGASGSMGHVAFKELFKHIDDINLTLFLRPSRKNCRMFKNYFPGKNISHTEKISDRGPFRIVWGDLRNYEEVREAVRGAEYILHPAALISPEADHRPEDAYNINVGGIENIIRAVREEPDGMERIKIATVGSVAQYGDRLPPIHRIRTGDPMAPSRFDFYGTTKIAAERALIESGIKHWVSLRQTYIAIPDSMSLMDPIMYHQPIEQHIELNTAEDAGFGLSRVIDIPDDSDFWQRVYNMAGGESCRVIYIDYIDQMMNLLGMGDFKQIMDRDWFCLRNFHCGYFEDSHILHQYLGNQRQSLQDHYRQVKDAMPWYVPLGKYVPKPLIKNLVMKPMALRKDGPLSWKKNHREMEGRINAFFGSLERSLEVGGWEDIPEIPAESRLLEHGYDTSVPVESLTLKEIQEAARFRGGMLLSSSYNEDRSDMLKWRCAFGHEFEASPALVLLGGHWCPHCEAPGWNHDAIARVNPFFAQVHYNTHEPHEENVFDEEICRALVV